MAGQVSAAWPADYSLGLDAWNRHRDEWFAEVFAPGGTHCDLMTGDPIPAAALPGYAARLRSMLPDLRFAIVSTAESQDGLHAALANAIAP